MNDEKTVESAEIYDLRGVKCPINFVKTKLKLEMMDEGEQLALLLDDGEPILNVPRSIKDEGHKILKVEKVDEYYKVLVQKIGE